MIGDEKWLSSMPNLRDRPMRDDRKDAQRKPSQILMIRCNFYTFSCKASFFFVAQSLAYLTAAHTEYSSLGK